MSNSGSQQRAFGSTVRDLSVSHLCADGIVTKLMTAIQVRDENLALVEQDIFDVQELVNANSEDVVNNAEDIADIENTVSDLQFTGTLPWFTKSNFVWENSNGKWDSQSIPDSASDTFVRRITTGDVYNSAILFLPSNPALTPGARHVGISTNGDSAIVYVTTNPLESIRLSSYTGEFFPASVMPHQTLFAGSQALGNRLFGTHVSPNGQCVALYKDDTSNYYIDQIFLDNGSGNSTTDIVIMFTKDSVTSGATLPNFDFYGIL